MKDYLGYKGKKVVVTGAASGIGKAVCEILSDLGAEVYGLDLNEPEISLAKFIQVNLAEKESIDTAFTKLPEKFDAFFGIAGLSGSKLPFNLTYTVNLIANKYITEEYLFDRINDGGAIMYMASNTGSRWRSWKDQFRSIIEAGSWEESVKLLEEKQQVLGEIGYSASKRSLVQYSKYIALKLFENNVRVNTISPAVTATPLLKDFQEMSGDPKVSTNVGPRQEFATAEEIANATAFINSDMASYINGHDLLVDDGWSAKIELETDYGEEHDNHNILASRTE